MAAVAGSTLASDAGWAFGQHCGPALAAAPWAPISAALELLTPPNGPLQVRAPQLATCCVAHKMSNAKCDRCARRRAWLCANARRPRAWPTLRLTVFSGHEDGGDHPYSEGSWEAMEEVPVSVV